MKPSLPQGTRDFSPIVVRRRQYILNTIKEVFELCGFQPLETPAMENLSTLTGKYGEEGDRLIFKILNNGLNNPKNGEAARPAFEKALQGYSDPRLTERALRYDLTIPFARYVVMHQNDLAFPFRRYQMQPVWRADRPQKGRYREFWQCDADVVGSDSLINEAELLRTYSLVFDKLGMPGVEIKLNNRKVLAGLAERCGTPERMIDITVAIDKLDKIGWEGVEKELIAKELGTDVVAFVKEYLEIGHEDDPLARMERLLEGSAIARTGIEELRQVLDYYGQLCDEGDAGKVKIDFTLARGLNYYTGTIVEVGTTAVTMSSIGGGGRYDDLTGLFGLKGLSGVGISFGVDRIYDVLDELGLFEDKIEQGTRLLFVNIEPKAEAFLLRAIGKLRARGIATEIFPDKAKFDKQMKYANKRNVPFVGIVGASEWEEGVVQVKDMATGQQEKMAFEALPDWLAARQ